MHDLYGYAAAQASASAVASAAASAVAPAEAPAVATAAASAVATAEAPAVATAEAAHGLGTARRPHPHSQTTYQNYLRESSQHHRCVAYVLL